MSTPLRHCFEIFHPPIWIRQGGRLPQQRPSAGAAAAGGLRHLASALGSPESSDLAPSASQPSPPRGAMADGGETRPQTQSHPPGGLRCKFGETLKIKFGRQTRRLNAFFNVADWSSVTHHLRVPHHGHGAAAEREQHREPVPQHLPTQRRGLWAERRGAKGSSPCFKRFGITPQIVSNGGCSLWPRGCTGDCYNPTEAGSGEAGSIKPEHRARAEL